MAVVTVKSTTITNRDNAAYRKLTNPRLAKGALLEMAGVCALANGDDIASKYIFGSIPSNARVSQVLISCPDIGTTTIADFGLYKTTDDGGAVVDADFFGSAVSLKDGALSNSDITHESGVLSPANVEKMVWEVLGLSSDPQIQYDVVATLTAASDAAASLACKVRYV